MREAVGNSWIHPYGLTVATAAVLLWWMARRRAVHARVDPSHVDVIVPLAILGGGLAARLLAHLDPADGELAGPLLAVPGRTRIWPLLAGGGIVVLAYARVARLRFATVADLLAPPAALSLAVVRVGCLLAGCCWGDVTTPSLAPAAPEMAPLIRQVQTVPWLGGWVPPALRFPAGSFAHAQHVALGVLPPDAPSSLPVHPVQLYEAGLLVALAGGASRGGRRWRAAPGRTAGAVLLGYAALRFVAEFLRADNRLVLAALTMPQVVCVAAAGTALALTLSGRRRRSFE